MLVSIRRDSTAAVTEQIQVTAAAAFNSSTFDVVAILRLDISDFLLQNTLNIDRASDPDKKKIHPSEVLVAV